MTNHPGEVLVERDGLTVVNCRACGFYHLREFPDSDMLGRFYRSGFWESKTGALEHYLEQKDWTLATYTDWLSLVEGRILGRTLLDVGCGYGWMLDAAQPRGWSVSGIEPSTDAFDFCRTRHNVIHAGWENALVYQPGMPDLWECITALWLI